MSAIDRRSLLRIGSAAATVAVVGLPGVREAAAHAPQVWKQAPGFYRFTVGTLEITVLSDGIIAFPMETLWPVPPQEVATVLAAEFRPSNPPVLQLNTVLVNTGDKLVLFDAGAGGKFQSTNGTLLANLAAAGYRAEDIDTVVFTHAHPDHLWGATDAAGSRLLFPAADYVCTETEFAFWSASELPGKVPSGMRQMVETTQANLKVVAAGRFSPIKAGAEIVPDIASVDTAGHTPGHISIHLTSGSTELLISGDVIANPSVSLHRPDWPAGFDMDKEQGAKTRTAFLDRAAADRTLVASYHLPFPGVGHVARDGAAYRWIPAEWQWG